MLVVLLILLFVGGDTGGVVDCGDIVDVDSGGWLVLVLLLVEVSSASEVFNGRLSQKRRLSMLCH